MPKINFGLLVSEEQNKKEKIKSINQYYDQKGKEILTNKPL